MPAMSPCSDRNSFGAEGIENKACSQILAVGFLEARPADDLADFAANELRRELVKAIQRIITHCINSSWPRSGWRGPTTNGRSVQGNEKRRRCETRHRASPTIASALRPARMSGEEMKTTDCQEGVPIPKLGLS